MRKINSQISSVYLHKGHTIELDGLMANCEGCRWVTTTPDKSFTWRSGSLREAQASIDDLT